MSALKPMRPQTRLGGLLSELSPVQHAVVGFTTWLLAFTLIHDAFICIRSPLWGIEYLGIFGVCLVATFFGTAMPCVMILELPAQIQEFGTGVDKRWPMRLVAAGQMVGYIGILLLFTFLCIAPFLFVELFFAVSVVPFTTIIGTVCAVFWLCFGLPFMEPLPNARRLAILAVVILFILSVRYVDWNTRKPFARHLFQVQRGMTGIQVERIMGQHLKNWVQPESEHYLHLDPNYTGETWYRHTTGGWANADWGKVVFKEGRVVDVEICLCD